MDSHTKMTSKKESFNFRSWCQKELSKHLNCDVEGDLMNYLMTIESEKDVKEYLHDLLTETRSTQLFIDEFFRHWHPPEHIPPSFSNMDKEVKKPSKENLVLYSKKTLTALLPPLPPPGFTSGSNSCEHSSPSNSTTSTSSVQNNTNMTSLGKVQSSHGGRRKLHPKQNFVPLISKEGQDRATMHLPGRHTCQCLAQRHTLINNCVKCGRIVCSQEGSGPCIFCGTVVCTPEEEEWLTKDSKKARKLREQFLKKYKMEDIGRPLDHVQRSDEALNLQKAEHHKEKLLEFDQTSASRTRVIDDESDYFSVDASSWLSASEKEALQSKTALLREKKYGSRRNKPVSIDIAGRRVIQEESLVNLYDEQHAKAALRASCSSDTSEDIRTHAGGLYNTAIPVDRPKFVEDKKKKKRSDDLTGATERKPSFGGRLQDNALQEMKDEGYCLSMHQPWATLLVTGIKKCEGRTWYTAHRGRLWIAATAKEPSDRDISEVHESYLRIYRECKEDLFFPSEFPTSCLLGSVNVLDCLSQDDYREKFPEGESESDFVFTVNNAQQLTVKFSIKGHHKIWKLERPVHLAAKRGLQSPT